jgi:hypothetical protein
MYIICILTALLDPFGLKVLFNVKCPKNFPLQPITYMLKGPLSHAIGGGCINWGQNNDSHTKLHPRMRLFRSRNFHFATLKTPEINPFEPFAWTPGICNNDNKGQGTILTDLLHM